MYKRIEWKMEKPETVELTHDKPIESQDKKYNKTNYWYGIKERINSGENGFNATEKLHQTIQDRGFKAGDKFTITKTNNGDYTYFKVDGESSLDEALPNQSNTGGLGGDINIKDIKVEIPVDQRFASLEREIDALTKRVNTLEANKPLSKDEIPF